jgi:cyclophilin family peptidyl-prolyl cis-trans isomerase
LDHELKARAGTPDEQPRWPDLHRIAGKAAFFLSRLDVAERHFTELDKYEKYSDGIVQQIRKALPEERQYWEAETKLREAETKAAKDPQALLPRVKLQTTQGDITLELFENEAPNTVANFITLVESKFYDNKPFFQVANDSAKAGQVAATENALDFSIAFEATSKNFRRHFYGSLFMHRPGGKDSASSVFGIALLRFFPAGDPKFDEEGDHIGGNTVFGRVVEGFDVLHKLQRVNPLLDTAAEPDKIKTATVVRKRNHEYKPNRQGQGSKAR